MIIKKDFEELVAHALSSVPKDIDTRKDISFMYNAIASCCLELAEMYKNNEITFNESFAKTSSRNNLIRRCEDRNIQPYPATSSVYIGKFNQMIDRGTKFKIQDFIFESEEQIKNENDMYFYKLVCTNTGNKSNNIKSNEKITPIEPIDGLETAEVDRLFSSGEEEEETEHLRERYFNSFDVIAMGGNKKQYEEIVESMDGIKAVKVKPPVEDSKKAPGTVTLILLGSENKTITIEKIGEISKNLDPDPGKGLGMIPIGHRVEVQSVTEVTVNFEITYIQENIVTKDELLDPTKKSIQTYFDNLNNNWKKENITIRKNYIVSGLLSQLKGSIKDVSNIKISIGNQEMEGDYKQLGDQEIVTIGSIHIGDNS